jgi:hypothetical protein
MPIWSVRSGELTQVALSAPPNTWNYLDNLLKIQSLWLYSEILFKKVWGIH